MTTAPAALRAARTLLLEHLGPHGLDPLAVGIVGNAAHRGGYHCGADRVVTNDYSVVESYRDRTGLTDAASALDIGLFRANVGGRVYDLRHLSAWLVRQCEASTSDARDIREVIWSPDGVTVRRWDRLGRRATGDSSHRTHTHISYHRDAVKAGRDQTPLYRRYLTEIGLIQASEGDDMPTVEEIWAAQFGPRDNRKTAGQLLAEGRNAALGTEAAVGLLAVQVAQLAGRDLVDEQQLAADLAPVLAPALLATLTPAAIAAAVPPELARQVVDELRDRLTE